MRPPPARAAEEGSCVAVEKSLLAYTATASVSSSRRRPGTCLTLSQGSDCVYDLAKGKPGLEPGAVESLSRRVGEVRVLPADCQSLRSCSPQTFWRKPCCRIAKMETRQPQCQGARDSSAVINVLSLLAKELHKLNSA